MPTQTEFFLRNALILCLLLLRHSLCGYMPDVFDERYLACPSRFWMVLTMVYNTRNYWVFGRSPSSDIPKNAKEHNVSKTGCVSILSLGVGDTFSVESVRKSWLRLALSDESNRVWVTHPLHLRTETDPVSKSCSLKYRTMYKVEEASNSECHKLWTLSMWFSY
jgi:hypothetical protein